MSAKVSHVNPKVVCTLALLIKGLRPPTVQESEEPKGPLGGDKVALMLSQDSNTENHYAEFIPTYVSFR